MSWVTLLLLASLAVGGYLAYVWVPVYVLHYEVKQVVRDYGNQSVKNPNDSELVQHMTEKIRSLGDVEILGPDGQPEQVPAVDLRPQDVTWERGPAANTLHVAFEYPRQIRYPLLDRAVETVLHVDVTMDVSRPNWGPAR